MKVYCGEKIVVMEKGDTSSNTRKKDMHSASVVISDDGVVIKSRFSKPYYASEYKSRSEYWKERCELAESYIEETPSDPDLYPEQWEAYKNWVEFKLLEKPELDYNRTGKLPDGEYDAIIFQDQLQVVYKGCGYNFVTSNFNVIEIVPKDVVVYIKDGLLQWWK
jgi:hypothetical protein